MEVKLSEWQEIYIRRNKGVIITGKATILGDMKKTSKKYIYKKIEVTSTDGIKFRFDIPFKKEEMSDEIYS